MNSTPMDLSNDFETPEELIAKQYDTAIKAYNGNDKQYYPSSLNEGKIVKIVTCTNNFTEFIFDIDKHWLMDGKWRARFYIVNGSVIMTKKMQKLLFNNDLKQVGTLEYNEYAGECCSIVAKN